MEITRCTDLEDQVYKLCDNKPIENEYKFSLFKYVNLRIEFYNPGNNDGFRAMNVKDKWI